MSAVLLLVMAVPMEPLPIVAIDPGHGGVQQGARGPCGATEKDITLKVATELARLLTASQRAAPVLTRTTDVTVGLEDRARIANERHASLLMSIHANASRNRDSRGIETFFLSRRAADRRNAQLVARENEGMPRPRQRADDALARILNGLLLHAAHAESQRLAIRVQDAMRRLSRDRGVHQAPFIVLLAANMSSALVEIGFLTNPEECRLLASGDHQRRIAQALAAAVLDHLANDNTGAARH